VDAVLREITKLCAIRDRSVVTFSVIPSAKYCWSGSLLRLANGNTTIDRRGATKGCAIDAAVAAVDIGAGEAVACAAGFPVPGRAVRGKSGIAEAELILGILALWTAWVDGWGFVDGADVAALEEAQGDEIGETQDRDLDAVAAGGDAQPCVGDHRGEELETDRVVVVAEKAADVEMLFDPAN
jgi:hypothetical protein